MTGAAQKRRAISPRRGMLQEKAVMKKLTLFLIPFLALLAGSGYKVVHIYPHDREAYTVGHN